MSTHLITHRPSLTLIPHPWEKPIETFELALRAQGIRETSISTRVRHIRRLARDLNGIAPADVTADDLITWAGKKLLTKRQKAVAAIEKALTDNTELTGIEVHEILDSLNTPHLKPASEVAG